jgi:hypothetical protein
MRHRLAISIWTGAWMATVCAGLGQACAAQEIVALRQLNLQSLPGSGTKVTCLFLPTSREVPSNGYQPLIHAGPARAEETIT